MVVVETEGSNLEDNIWIGLVSFLKYCWNCELDGFVTRRDALLQGETILDLKKNLIMFMPDSAVDHINRMKLGPKVDRPNLVRMLEARGVGGMKTWSINGRNHWAAYVDYEAVDQAAELMFYKIPQEMTDMRNAEAMIGPIREPRTEF